MAVSILDLAEAVEWTVVIVALTGGRSENDSRLSPYNKQGLPSTAQYRTYNYLLRALCRYEYRVFVLLSTVN